VESEELALNQPWPVWYIPVLQDAGTATTILYVRDVDGVLARMKQAGVPVITHGGAPIEVDFRSTKGRSVIVRDPDGHAVQLVQPRTIPADASSTEVIDGGVRVTIHDTDRTMGLYRDLGFEPASGGFTADRAFNALIGLERAEYRLTTAPVPGEPRLTFEFIEYRRVDRKPLQTRIQDPGAVRFNLIVRDLDAAVAKFRKAGATVVTSDGQPVSLGANRYIIVRDPNNLFIILHQQVANQ
jgi:catechol 2,3-dioxygenase-like lactoylglutathione lyase family enzyme